MIVEGPSVLMTLPPELAAVEGEVIEQSDEPLSSDDIDQHHAVEIRYNRRYPNRLSDGIDSIVVAEWDDDQYLINYVGYDRGRLIATDDGIARLGSELLGDRDQVPKWVIERRGIGGKLPWWVPDGYEDGREVACQTCDELTPVGELLTPSAIGEQPICEDCWENSRYTR
ncbi:hypothetical protein RYH80_19425 [Halobaculum sp. MBLA0147]|uniref:hypothetical protein n=1 Tax=Halobaculum sp. MBLA0147 TaxID=3079934 RepID=UPI003525BD9D